jgi:hypothetical protein
VAPVAPVGPVGPWGPVAPAAAIWLQSFDEPGVVPEFESVEM